MTLHITHFTSVEAHRTFYLRFSGQEFWVQCKKLRSFPTLESNWIEMFPWVDGKTGAWRITERVWDVVIGDFENGLEVHNAEHERVAGIKREQQERADVESENRTFASAGMGGYSEEFIRGIYEAFMAGNEERMEREAAWKAQGYRVPRSGVFVVEIEEEAPPLKTTTPDLVKKSDHIVLKPIQTVDEALGILGLNRNPSPVEAKRAYRTLAMEWSPDRHFGDASCEEKMRRLNLARDIVWRNYHIK